jgi:hypothetical protein
MKLAFHLSNDPAYDELNAVLQSWSREGFDAMVPDVREAVWRARLAMSRPVSGIRQLVIAQLRSGDEP